MALESKKQKRKTELKTEIKTVRNMISMKVSFVGGIMLYLTIIKDILKRDFTRQFISVSPKKFCDFCAIIVILVSVLFFLTKWLDRWFETIERTGQRISHFTSFTTFSAIIIFVIENLTEYSNNPQYDMFIICLLGMEIMIGGLWLLLKEKGTQP